MAAITTSAEQGRNFHLFSRLPAELRWKIWDFNLPGPRIVAIKCGPESLSSFPGLDSGGRLSPSSSSGCTSSAAIPANLHVCHESRREALRQYRPCFGVARQPGQVFFGPDRDVLYFGPRDGFMASEANLRTVLSLCDPAELAQVKRVAINDALFWVYENAWHHRPRHQPPPHQNPHQNLTEGGQRPWQQQPPPPPQQQQQQQQPAPPIYSPFFPPPAPLVAAPTMTHAAIAASLLADVLRLVHARLPALQELVFVPRDENPLYSGDSCLVEPSIVQSRMARQVREAMRAVFPGGSAAAGPGGGGDGSSEPPWAWRIMTLSADPNPPVYEKRVLGWQGVDSGGCAGAQQGRCCGGGGGRCLDDCSAAGRKAGGRGATRLSVMQESARRRFVEMEREMAMEVDGCGQ